MYDPEHLLYFFQMSMVTMSSKYLQVGCIYWSMQYIFLMKRQSMLQINLDNNKYWMCEGCRAIVWIEMYTWKYSMRVPYVDNFTNGNWYWLKKTE